MRRTSLLRAVGCRGCGGPRPACAASSRASRACRRAARSSRAEASAADPAVVPEIGVRPSVLGALPHADPVHSRLAEPPGESADGRVLVAVTASGIVRSRSLPRCQEPEQGDSGSVTRPERGFGWSIIPASEIDTSRAHPARMYDAYLGGKDDYAADREAVRRVLQTGPAVRDTARANRAFLQRAVRFLAGEAGSASSSTSARASLPRAMCMR
jgi:hypothetical protein